MALGAVELTGLGITTCPQGAILTLRAAGPTDASHETIGTALLARHAADQPFLLTTAIPEPGLHLELEIDPPPDKAPCDVTLKRLQLHSVTTGNNNTNGSGDKYGSLSRLGARCQRDPAHRRRFDPPLRT